MYVCLCIRYECVCIILINFLAETIISIVNGVYQKYLPNGLNIPDVPEHTRMYCSIIYHFVAAHFKAILLPNYLMIWQEINVRILSAQDLIWVLLRLSRSGKVVWSQIFQHVKAQNQVGPNVVGPLLIYDFLSKINEGDLHYQKYILALDKTEKWLMKIFR